MGGEASRKAGLLRKLLVVGGAAAALLVVLAVVLPFVLPVRRIADAAAKEAGRTLHREVSIGAVSFSLFKGIVVSGVRVGERAGFGAGPLLSVDELRVRYSLLSLLRMKPVIGSVRVVRPSIAVARNEAGELSISDLAAGAAGQAAGKGPAPSTAPSAPLDFLVTSVVVRDGSAHFRDAHIAPGRTVESRIQKLSCDLGNLTLTGTMTYALSCEVAGLGEPARVKLSGTVNLATMAVSVSSEISALRPGSFDPYLAALAGLRSPSGSLDVTSEVKLEKMERVSQKASLRITGLTLLPAAGGAALVTGFTLPVEWTAEAALRNGGNDLELSRATLSLPGVAVEAKGSVKGLASPPVLDLAADARIAWGKLLPALGGLSPPELRASGEARCELSFRGRTDDLKLAGTFDATASEFAFAGAATKPAGAALTARFRAAVGKAISASVDEAKLAEVRGPGGQVIEDGRLSASLSGNKIRFDLSARRLDGKAALAVSAVMGGAAAPPSAPRSTAVPGERTAQVSGAASGIPAELTVDGKVSCSELVYEKYRLSDFAATVRVAKRVLSVDPMTMKAYGGGMTARARADLGARPVASQMRFDVKDVEANGFLAAASKVADGVFGKLSARGEASARGVEDAEIKKSTSGKGEFAVREGKLANPPVVREIGAALGKPLPEDVRFRSLTGRWVIRDGQVEVNDIRMDGDDLAADGRATVSLDGALGGRIKTRLSPALSDKLGLKYGRDRSGWMPLAFELAGTVEKPAVKLDTAALLRGVGEELLKDKGKEELKKGLEKLFGK